MHHPHLPRSRERAPLRTQPARLKKSSILAVLSLLASVLGVVFAPSAGAQTASQLEIVKTSWRGPSCPNFIPPINNFPPTFDNNYGFIGAPVTYCYVVRNLDADNPIYNVSITDDNATIGNTADDFVLNLLAPNGTPLGTSTDLGPAGVAYATHTATFSATGNYTNLAVATGNTANDNSGTQETNGDITKVDIYDITVEKVADQASVNEGDPVTFTFTVKNNSIFENYDLATLVDSVFGDVTQYTPLGQGDCTLPRVVFPTASYSCQITQTLDAPGTHSNTITAGGTGPDGTPVGGEDSEDVQVVDTPASIEVDKSADLITVPASGAPVTFTIVVTNTSAVDSVEIDQITDSVFGNLNVDCGLVDGAGNPTPITLAAGASTTCTFVRTISGDNGTTHSNTATATGTSDDGDPLTAGDDEEIFLENDEVGSIRVRKTADLSEVPESGADVTFTFRIKNTSNTVDLTLTDLVDSVFGDISVECGIDNAAGVLTPLVLAAQQEHTCTIVRNISGQFGTQHRNVVTAFGEDENGNDVDDRANQRIDIIDEPASIEVDKSADLSQVPASGAPVTFTIVVTNTSAADSVDIEHLTDTIYGNLDVECGLVDSAGNPTPVTLAVGGSMTCTFVRTVSGNGGTTHSNVATATGTSDDGDPLADDDDEEIAVEAGEPAEIRVRKRANVNEVPESGADVTFRFVIRNMSNTVDVTLTDLVDSVFGDISVECGIDNAAGVLTPIVLAPQQQHVCSIVRNISGPAGTQHLNRVTASGEDENGNDVTDRATERIDIIDEPGAISIAKTASPSTVPATGGNVDFTFNITNDSATDDVFFGTLIDSVYGDLSNECGFTPPVTIAPGQSATCTITRFVAAGAASGGGGGSSYTGTPPTTKTYNYVVDEPTPPPCSGQQWLGNGVRMGSFQGYALILVTGMTLGAGTWAVDDFTAWDADIDRPNYPQTHEIVRIEFWKNGQRVASSNATQDLPDGFVSAVTTGSLGTVNLPNGADQVRIVHSNIFQGSVGTNSLDPISLCMEQVSPPLDLTPHVNTVEGCGEDDDGQTVCASDDATVAFNDSADDGPSSIRVTKSANKSTITSGQTARFTFTVTNTSANDTVTITNMTDSVYGNVGATCNLPRLLAPGQTMTCQMVRGVSGPAGTNHYNVLNVSGMDDDNGPVGGSDDTTIALTGSYQCRGGTATWWKNYSQYRWPSGIRHNTPIEPNLTPTYANYNWLQAVSLPGNNSAAGIRRHLIREASAAILNELATPPAYPVSSVNVIQAAVNNALAQGSPTEMWRIARILFNWNRSMCNN